MTEDDGNNWIRIHKSAYYAPINALTAGNGFILAGRGGEGVLRSTDSGANWAVANKGLYAIRVNDMFKYQGNLLAATDGNGIYQSKDLGENWTVLSSGVGPYLGDRYISDIGKSGDNLLAGSSVGGFLSSDAGLTWKNVLSGSGPFANLGRYVFTGNFKDGIYRSSDNGANWTNVKVNGSPAFDAQVYSLAADDNTVYAGTGSRILISRDSGTTWTGSDSTLPKNTGVYALMVSGNAVIAATKNQGLFRSTDHGATWSPAIKGLPVNDPFAGWKGFSAMAEFNGNLFGAAYGGGVYLSANQGESWVKADSAHPLTGILSLVADGDYLYAGTNSNGIWRKRFSEMPVRTMPAREEGAPNLAGRLTLSAPYDGLVSIGYRVPGPQRVSIRIFTPTGREIARLFDGNAEAGSHTLVWDARNLDAGCYHIVMRAGNRTYSEHATLFPAFR